MPPRIAIIGAGPAGLTLARLLAVQSIVPQVFEREPSPDSRSQGGSLDLHEGTGQQAVHDSGLWEEFRKYARYDGQEIKFLTKNCDVMFAEHPKDERDPDTKPEIDRKILREMLLKSLDNNVIKWGYTLDSIQPQSSNPRLYDLHFKGGEIEKGFDLVVGADGAWSHVRSLLSAAKPFYSGVSMVDIDITRPDKGEVDKFHKWDSRSGLTLIGDAAHLMTPFAGEGVNVAMWDALELSKAIVAGVKEGDLDTKIRESEEALFKRAEDACTRTESNMQQFMKTSGAPDPSAIA
ncbi:FAD-binding domain protein [Ceratobasidium sp. AG-Ba]|nr:FAD-binding domain protein [Ceratobasidium sp. AG-Ba]